MNSISEPPEDLYAILGVQPTSTAAEIKSSYQRLLRFTHPDKTGAFCQTSSEAFHRVQRAWRTLGEPELRARYDRELELCRLSRAPPVEYELDLVELEWCEEARQFWFACRCGDAFRLAEDQAVPESVLVPCDSCSLVVRVFVPADHDNDSAEAESSS